MDAMITNRASSVPYNAADLNRVEGGMQELCGRLNDDFGFNLLLTFKVDWAASDVPTLSDMERYRQNLAAIRAVILQRVSTPSTPDSMRFLTWARANDIERILQDVEWLLDRMPFAFRHSGACISGQGGLIR